MGRCLFFVCALSGAVGLAADRPRNPVGIHTLFQDYMTEEIVETHLAWARHLVGGGGWIKAMILPITPDMEGPEESWRIMITRAYEMGLNAILRMDEPLGNASPPGVRGDYAEIAAAYARVAAGLLEANPTDRPVWFEIRNEPNNAVEWSNAPDPVAYGRFYVAVVRAIRALNDSRAKCTIGALSPGGSYDNLKFIDVLCTIEGFGESLDGWATHAYPGNTPPEINLHDGTARTRYEAIDGYLKEFLHLQRGGVDTAGLPVMITEMSYDLGGGAGGHPALDQGRRAAYFVRAYRDFWMQWPEIMAVCPYYMVSLWARSPENHEWVMAQTRPAFDGRPQKAHEHYWVVAGLAKPGQSTGAVNGQVRDQFGNEIADVPVQLDGRPVPSKTNSAGLYQHSGLAPGTYSLSARRSGHEPVQADFTIRAGMNTALDLVMPVEPPFGELRVTVRTAAAPGGKSEAVEGAAVELRRHNLFAATDRNGTALLRGLRPGPCRVVTGLPGHELHVSDEVMIAAGQRTSLTVTLRPNLIENGGMEPRRPEDRGVAPGWQSPSGAPVPWMHLDNTTRRSGATSQRIDAEAGTTEGLNFVSHWTDYSSVTPGAAYELSGYVKSMAVTPGEGEGARLRLEFYSNDDQFHAIEVHSSDALAGDADWTRLTVSALAPRGADRVRTILVNDAIRGSAWFDDIVLHEVLPPEPPLWERVQTHRDAWEERELFGMGVVWGLAGSGFGMTDERYLRLRELMRELGVTAAGVGVAWGDVERERGTWDWSNTDRNVELITSDGTTVVGCYAVAPAWARGMTSPADFEPFGGSNLHTVVMPLREYTREYREFTAAMAARYRGRVDRFQFWNEPDSNSGPILLRDKNGIAIDVREGGDPVEFTYWLKHTYEAIREGNPDAQVGAAGLVGFDTGFLEGIYANGGRHYMDAIAIHPYSEQGINKEWIEEIRNVMRRHGDFDKPLWITEYGWWVGARDADIAAGIFPAGLRDQADYLRDALGHFRMLPYITYAAHHTLNDWYTAEGVEDSIMRMGLVTADLQGRKPAFHEWQALVGESLDRIPTGEVRCEVEAPTPVFWGTEQPIRCTVRAVAGVLPEGRAVLYQLPGEHAVATWNVGAGNSEAAFEYVYHAGPGSVSGTISGFALEYRRIPGRAIARAERYLEVCSPLAFHPIPAATVPYDLLPGDRPALRVVNHGPVPVTFAPRGDVADPGPLTVPAGASLTIPLALRGNGEGPAAESLHVAAWVDGAEWGRYDGWYYVPMDVPRRKGDGGMPQLRIDPPARHPDFAEDDSLNASVALEWDEEMLYLRVAVRETEHRQTRQPADMWREDSVQVAFDTRRDGGAAYRYDDNDYEFGFGLFNGRPVTWRWAAAPWPDGYVGRVDSVMLQVEHREGRTVYDARLPWDELGIDNPEPGLLMGICIVVNDATPDGRRFLEWPPMGITHGKNPARFGSLRLVK